MSRTMRVYIKSMTTDSGIPGTHVQCEYLAKGGHMDPTKGAMVLSPEAQMVLHAAKGAADAVECELRIVDVDSLGLVGKIKEALSGRPVPRIEIGESMLTGTPTMSESSRSIEPLSR